MAHVQRTIGLSLGADICWPICFEELIRRLDLSLSIGGDTVEFNVERLTIEPFDLQQPCKYDVVLDRLTHWYHTSREWIKKAILLDDLYVLNNPWTLQSMEKHTSYCAMMRLGLRVPPTWMLPPKAYESQEDLEPTLGRYARLFDLGKIGDAIGYPLFMKPYDGGAWKGVSRIDDEKRLREAYDESGTKVMHLQKAVSDYDLFVRCIGVGPQVNVVHYDPSAPLHKRYRVDRGFASHDELRTLKRTTLTINTFFGWDFNSCEGLRKDGVFHLIDFANACPDSQVTSLHYHFPWLVTAQARWAIFCAATQRKMRQNVDWQPYYDVADRDDLSADEKLTEYGRIAAEVLEADRFQEFCDEHLAHLDEVSWELFGSDIARSAVRAKVEALFPEHEHEEFTEHFWELIQEWRRDQEAG